MSAPEQKNIGSQSPYNYTPVANSWAVLTTFVAELQDYTLQKGEPTRLVYTMRLCPKPGVVKQKVEVLPVSSINIDIVFW